MTEFLPAISGPAWLDRIRAIFPDNDRERVYRYAASVVMFLAAFGLINDQEAALWTQLGVGTVTLIFALLYATTPWRLALYSVTGPLGGILMSFGLVTDTRWALIVAATGQALGISTAAAKTIQNPITG